MIVYMKIYVLGNEEVEMDRRAIEVAKKLKNFPGVNWVTINSNEDLPVEKYLTLIDTVIGLPEVILLSEKDIEKLIISPGVTAHDYDLGFQLKYLIKIGKLRKVRIIGLPAEGIVDYERIQSILRKLVAQDMQGS
jgi:hypothetical protein